MANTYTKLAIGSRHVTIGIKNQTAVPIIIGKGIKVTWLVAANRIPAVELMPGTLEKIDEMQGVWWTKMSIECRKEMPLQQLDLPGLWGWPGTNCASTCALVTEYHIFSLEPGELGCTGLAKHDIRVVDEKPFKERFQRIPPPMVEEVRAHVKEMLELFVLAKAHGVTLSC